MLHTPYDGPVSRDGPAPPEHLIQFRRAWRIDRPDGRSGRVDLPGEAPGSCRLGRLFGLPPLEAGAEALLLRLADVPGLLGLSLNGRPLPWERGAPGADLLLDPTELRARGNRLELEVGEAEEGGGPWGRIALVIRPA